MRKLILKRGTIFLRASLSLSGNTLRINYLFRLFQFPSSESEVVIALLFISRHAGQQSCYHLVHYTPRTSKCPVPLCSYPNWHLPLSRATHWLLWDYKYLGFPSLMVIKLEILSACMPEHYYWHQDISVHLHLQYFYRCCIYGNRTSVVSAPVIRL